MKTPLQAAQDIAHLINSRVQSPRIDEMEAIIAGVSTPQHVCADVDPLGPVTTELAAAFFAWDQARIRNSEELDDHEARARQDIIAEKTAALFAIGVRSFADLRLLVPVVAYWNSPGSVKSPDYPECVLELGGKDEGEGFEPKSVAYLVRAVIGLLGMEALRRASRSMQGRVIQRWPRSSRSWRRSFGTTKSPKGLPKKRTGCPSETRPTPLTAIWRRCPDASSLPGRSPFTT